MERIAGWPETLLTGFAAVLVTAAVLGLLLRGWMASRTGRAAPSAETEALRSANVDLEKKLAVAEHRASMLAEVERKLTEALARADAAGEVKSGVEADLAASREAVSAQARETLDLRGRLTASETAVSDRDAELRELREAKSRADEAVAAGTQAVKDGEERAADLGRRLQAAAADLAEAAQEASSLRTANAKITETLEQERTQAEDKLRLLVGARAEMSDQFRKLADEVMSRHGENFSKLNKDQIDGILTPLKEKLGEFERNVQSSQAKSTEERATLAEQIRHIAATGAVMGKETKELTEALRGRSQMQGAWGEMVLETILEGSGLRADEEYVLQKSFAGEEGRRLRPDVVVNLPGGQHVVIDAKVSLNAFEALCSAENDEQRHAHRMRHLASVRNHIGLLGSKDYHAAAGTTLDYVLMFVPIEGALAAALHADRGLLSYALERKVTLTSPSTLMIALRTVSNVWQVEKRNRNAEEIAVRAGKLYDKFVGFVTDLTAVGDSIAKSKQQYDGAMGKLATGNGNVLRQLETLKDMGARASKSLPPALVDRSEGTVTLALTTQTVETETKVETVTAVMTASFGGGEPTAPIEVNGAVNGQA